MSEHHDPDSGTGVRLTGDGRTAAHPITPSPHHPIIRRAGSGLNNIPRWSIEHPYVVVAFYFAVVVLAILTIGFSMPRRFAPYVPSPIVGVVTMMPGLSAQEMELYVSKPIEEQLNNVKDLHYVRSTSQDGFSIVILEFNYGVDIKQATVNVQSLLNIVQASLPS